MARPDEAATTSAAKRNQVRERAIMTPRAKIPIRETGPCLKAGCYMPCGRAATWVG